MSPTDIFRIIGILFAVVGIMLLIRDFINGRKKMSNYYRLHGLHADKKHKIKYDVLALGSSEKIYLDNITLREVLPYGEVGPDVLADLDSEDWSAP